MDHYRIVPSVLLIGALALGEGSALLRAQSAADTVTLATALGEVIADEASRPGDHRAPFTVDTSSGSAWGRAVAAAFRSHHSDLLAPAQAHALHLSVGGIRFVGDTAYAIVHWSRCTSQQRALNYWQHTVTYLFLRSETGWRFANRKRQESADGHC